MRWRSGVRPIAQAPLRFLPEYPQTLRTAAILLWERPRGATGRNYEPDTITSPAIDYDYTLDDVGNLTRIQSAIEGEQRYGYDNLDRLESIREQNDALIESFAYDATGNRTSHTVGASTTSYSYPGSSHRLEQVGAQARAFDAAGNTVSGIAGSSFAFDARNRLVEVNAGGAIRQRMNYNVAPAKPRNPHHDGLEAHWRRIGILGESIP